MRLCRHKGNKSLASFPATIDGNDKKKGQQFGNGDSQPDSRYSPQNGHQPETEQDEDKTTQQGDSHGRKVAFYTLEIAYGYNVDAEAHEAGSKLRGKVRIAVLYARAVSLNLLRSTLIRFSVPSSCACNSLKFSLAFKSG